MKKLVIVLVMVMCIVGLFGCVPNRSDIKLPESVDFEKIIKMMQKYDGPNYKDTTGGEMPIEIDGYCVTYMFDDITLKMFLEDDVLLPPEDIISVWSKAKTAMYQLCYTDSTKSEQVGYQIFILDSEVHKPATYILLFASYKKGTEGKYKNLFNPYVGNLLQTRTFTVDDFKVKETIKQMLDETTGINHILYQWNYDFEGYTYYIEYIDVMEANTKMKV
ncbi:MAG: hypothetical protein RR316_00340 [Clostridia bacterium]